jgi:hypothetical protein
MVPCRVLTDSPFDTLEKTFDLLVAGPHPLALDSTSLDGLADRGIPLKAMLLHPSMSFDVRDAVVDELVARSRAKGGAWTVGVAGVLLPGLRRAVWALVQSCPGKAADIELADVAKALGISYKACHQRHPPDRYSPFEFVEKRPETHCSSNGGRPRQGRSIDRRPDKRRSTPTTPRT